MEPSPEILKSIVDNILIVNAALDELLKKPTFTEQDELKFYDLQRNEATLIVDFKKLENTLHCARLLALHEKLMKRREYENQASPKIIPETLRKKRLESESSNGSVLNANAINPLANSVKVYHANEKIFDVSQNLTDSREIKRSPAVSERPKRDLSQSMDGSSFADNKKIPSGLLPKKKSTKSLPDPCNDDSLNKGIVKGFSVNNNRTSPRSPYEAIVWSVGLGELVKVDDAVLYPNSHGAIVKKMKCRGDFVLTKEYDNQFMSTFDDFEVLKIEIENEAILSTISTSPFVVSEKGVCFDEGEVIFVREFVENDTLEKILNMNQPENSQVEKKYKLSFWRKMNIVQTVASAMDYVLEKQFTNPNLSFSNILFTPMWEVKLADQCYRSFKERVAKKLGTSLPPVDEPTLVYQFGIMIWRLITEQTGEVQMDNDSIWLPDICTSSLTDLISVCVSSDPSKRPTFKQLINSNFFDLIFFEADEKSIMLCKELWPIVSQNNCALWSEFFPIFCDKFNIECNENTQDTIEFQCLKHMFGCLHSGIITEEAYDRLIKCIGPFIEGGEVIDQVRALLEMPWFMGVLSASEADSAIEHLECEGKPFLVRFSSSTGDYSLTFKTKGKILHSRVPPMAKYNLHQYVSLLKLKKKFGESPPSPFLYLFENQKFPSCHSYKFIR